MQWTEIYLFHIFFFWGGVQIHFNEKLYLSDFNICKVDDF